MNKLIMDKKNILKEIKNLIFSTESETTEMIFKDAKVGDLIIRVEADEFTEGLPVLVVTEDGVIPASPDMAGEHVLEDGTKIVLDETGVITSVEKPEVEVEVETPEAEVELAEEPVKEEEVKEELVEEVKEEVKDEVVAELTGRVEKLEAVIEEMLAMTKDTANFSKIVQDKLDNFIKETPADLEFKSVKSEYKETVKQNKDNKFSGLESIKNLRKK